MDSVQVFPTPDDVAHFAAEQIVAISNAAIADRGRFSVGLSGGSTPKLLFALLASEHFAPRIDWANVHVFWGDERCVPPDHADSNYRMTRETLLDHVPVPPENVMRMQSERDPVQAAADYEQRLRAFFPDADYPRFDLLLQGMGNDGHTASLFPNTEALNEQSRWVVANYVPKFETWRITLTAPAINAAENVMFLVTGANKADALHNVLKGARQPHTYPSQLIQPTQGTLVWAVDQAAAAKL